MKKAKRSPKPVAQHGKGPIRHSFPQGKGGQINIQVDFSLARPPETYYYADALSISVDQEMGVAVLAFGRTNPEGGLRDRLDVVVPRNSLFGGFLNSVRPIEPSIDQQLEALKLRPVSRMLTGAAQLRGTLFANVIAVATAMEEANIDFYHMPARDIHFVKAGMVSEITLQPVMRILSSPVLLKHMISLCRQAAQGELSKGLLRRPERANVS